MRYNRFGPSLLGDRRRANGAKPTILTSGILAMLRERLKRPPDDGGVWTAKAAVIASELGLAKVADQRGWEALCAIGGTIQQTPAPARPGGGARGAGGLWKSLAEAVAEEAERHPGTVIETVATDEHRIGLKPILRRVWAPRGERPIAVGHHRFEWLCVTAFVSPRTGESFWYPSPGVSKQDFEDVLALFAREAGAGHHRIIVLGLDNAGWHSPPNLVVPEGIRLVYLPPYTPELQPAETLWIHLDEPVVNRPFDSLAELDAVVARQCARLAADRDRVRSQAGLHWWPDRVAPN